MMIVAYADAILAEMDARASELDAGPLKSDLLRRRHPEPMGTGARSAAVIAGRSRSRFGFDRCDIEITLEANPGTIRARSG